MKYFSLYNGENSYIFPNGMPAGEGELIKSYPLINQIPFILQTDRSGHIIFNISLLELLRNQYDISEEVSDEEAVEIIQEIENRTDDEVDSQIRIADALEDLVVLNMPDEEVE